MKVLFRITLVFALFIIVNSCKKSDTNAPTNPYATMRSNAMADYDNMYLATNVTSATWDGSTNGCNAGNLSSTLLSQVLTRLNYFRKEAGLAPIASFNPTLNAECQQAALMMMSNGELNHFPPSTWTCYSTAGAQATRSGDLAYNSAQLWTYSIDQWINDYSVPQLGHRRWILNTSPAASMGYGCTGTYAALYCDSFGATPANLPAFVAWPAKGYIPVQLIPAAWSISIPNADFTNTTVTMTDNNGLAVQISNPGDPGDGYADNCFAWYPQNLISSSNSTDYSYTVNVNDVVVNSTIMNYSYTVTFFLAK